MDTSKDNTMEAVTVVGKVVNDLKEEKVTLNGRYMGFWPVSRTNVTMKMHSHSKVCRSVEWQTDRGCCCCMCIRGKRYTVQMKKDTNVSIDHPRCCSPWGGCSVASSILLAFLMAFLIHLIPSVAIGVEVALGSSEMHQRMGLIWFGSFPFILAAMLIGRYCYLHALIINGGTSNVTTNGLIVDVPSSFTVGDRKKALELLQHMSHTGNEDESSPKIVSESNFDDGAKKSCDDQPWPPVIAFTILGALLIFAVVTGVLIIECQGRGQCYDGVNMTGRVVPPMGF